MRETYVIRPTITRGIFQVIGSLGNRVYMATEAECVLWAQQLGLNYDLEAL